MIGTISIASNRWEYWISELLIHKSPSFLIWRVQIWKKNQRREGTTQITWQIIKPSIFINESCWESEIHFHGELIRNVWKYSLIWFIIFKRIVELGELILCVRERERNLPIWFSIGSLRDDSTLKFRFSRSSFSYLSTIH